MLSQYYKQVCHTQAWLIKANLNLNTLHFYLQIKAEDQKTLNYSASINSLEGLDQLPQCFDNLQDLIQYMKQPGHVEIDIPTGTINIVQLSKIKKNRSIKLGEIKTKQNKTINNKSVQNERRIIKQTVKRCKQINSFNFNQIRQMMTNLAVGLDKLLDIQYEREIRGQKNENENEECNGDLLEDEGKGNEKFEEIEKRLINVEKQGSEILDRLQIVQRQKVDQKLVDNKISEQVQKMNKIIKINLVDFQKSLQTKFNFQGIAKQKQEANIKQIVKMEQIPEQQKVSVLQLSGSKDLKQFQSKQNLDLSSKKLSQFPTQLLTLKKLTVLKICDNSMESLPQDLYKLSTLQNLDLNRNKISKLPDTFANLKQLQTLWYSENQIQQFPSPICALKQLELLYVHNNLISGLPDSFCNLKMLKTLWAYGNKLEGLPENIGDLKRLKELQLQNNRLSKLPVSIGKLTNLQKFYLNSNKLVQLPQTLGNLAELRTLWIQKNKLEYLPPSITNLKQLKDLQTHDNRLLSLPTTIPGLIELSSLKLTIFPQSQIKFKSLQISKMKNLKNLIIIYHQPKQDVDSFRNQCRERGVALDLSEA